MFDSLTRALPKLLPGAALIALLPALLLPAVARAEWPIAIGGPGTNEVTAVQVAPTGDIYVAGIFSGLIETAAGSLASEGLQDIFVARVRASGDVIWIRSAGGELSDTVTRLALDSASNVYLVGQFGSSAAFGGTRIEAQGFVDGYVASISGSGTWRWARAISGSGINTAQALAIVPGVADVFPQVPETVMVAGVYECNADFGLTADDDPVTLSRPDCFPGRSDLFIARYTTSTGAVLSAVDRGSDSGGLEQVIDLAIDDQNRLTLMGRSVLDGLDVLLSSNFESGLQGWERDNSLLAGTAPFEGSQRLAVRGSATAARSPVVNTADSEALLVSLNVRRGRNQTGQTTSSSSSSQTGTRPCRNLIGLFLCRERTTITEIISTPGSAVSAQPSAAESLDLEYLDRDGIWRRLERFPGSGPGGESFNRTDGDAYLLTREEALHPNFRLRVRLLNGRGPEPAVRTVCVRVDEVFAATGAILRSRQSCQSNQLPLSDPRTGFVPWWHIDDVVIESIGAGQPFLLNIDNILSASGPSFGSVTELADGIRPQAMVMDSPRNRLVMSGTRAANVPVANCANSSRGGAFVSVFERSGSGWTCVRQASASGGEANALTVDGQGGVFLAGRFSGGLDFVPDRAIVSTTPTSTDLFVAGFDRDLVPLWLTGGGSSNDNEDDPNFGIPSYGGGSGNDAALALGTDGASSLYVGGLFRGVARFGPVDSLTSLGSSDGVLFTLGTDGRYFQEQGWVVGVPVTPPPNAELGNIALSPQFLVNGEPFDAIANRIFSWTRVQGQEARLIPLQPFGSIDILWRVRGEPAQSEARIPVSGSVVWPVEACSDTLITGCYQVHVVGAPVEAEPATGDLQALEVINPATGSSQARIESGQFSSERTGTASIVYVNGPTLDQGLYPTVVEVVRSLPYTLVPLFVDRVEVEIGQKITDPFHNEPNRNGWVINELAYYDGTGPDAAYNRNTRTGSIIPVNRTSPSRSQDQGRELAVAWYRANARGVFWPGKAVRYQPRWPLDPERIVIASQLGSEVLGQQPINPQLFPLARIYIQNDFNLPGYNPNDEHAFMAPSALGSGFDAVFALRSDFGAGLDNDAAAASDPYVLLKYRDTAANEWRFRVFRVDATGAGFSRFRFDGTAGTTIAPPYPLPLLGNCSETFAAGQAIGEPPPPPFFQDYSAQLWASSDGTGAVHFYYPAQPGFFTDLNNNDVNDIEGTACQPWLARLPEDRGGSQSNQQPIEVTYEISWPEQRPLLIAGETLLTPKRGLPDIFNQASVQIVFDEIQDRRAGAVPSDTLAQLIDPLNPRIVFLPQIPDSVATEQQTDGTLSILGSADGEIKLPVSIRDRLRYDPLNRRLILTGVFDASGAGDPLLLLNVLSKRDRVTLKTLDGGDGSEAQEYTNDCLQPASGCSWDQAVEALFRLSRNPQRIQSICMASRLNADRERICEASRSVNADDVLVGFDDPQGNGVLVPFRATGVQPALTAGASQVGSLDNNGNPTPGSGLMTVAFNNDPALSPLPVSLEVIQVGCLEAPPPDPIFAPYQGQINVIAPENIFDEQLVLRHSGDFGGNPDALDFEWFYQPDTGGARPTLPPQPEIGQLNGWLQVPIDNPRGAVEISIEGANIQTLSDNFYIARYRGLPGCNNREDWSLWAGSPGGTPRDLEPQLAEGWVKRVLGRLNPFEARVQNFAQAATNNYVSMLIQLGERYEGPVALNNDPDNLNSLGLIEAYTTVMRRAMQLSVDGSPPVNYGPANTAILLVASRLVDFYTLLGNEAFADAQDPTIGITTQGGTFSLAPSIFNFQNQLSSLLEEELVLLRGRDTTNAPVTARPVYNRLFWNFTTGDGEVAYALSYNITDQNDDGVIDEFDARIMYPQGHGDAWGHYLTAVKIYYDLLRHPFYTWEPRTERVSVAGVPIEVSFEDERQFAQTAAARARTGAEIVDLTYRSRYVEDPAGQFQGYTDTDPERAWGMSEWGRRAGMGAYFDWVTANSVLPAEDTDPANVGIRKIDRTTVRELGEIVSHYLNIQGQVDKADAGLNPLGLATGVVPFDIDPSLLESANKTQFEQIADRAMRALKNAVNVWDYANQLTNQMRLNQLEVDDLRKDSRAQENDFANQLIEIFGYPYADDIGPAGTYPAGYNGPDLYNYMLMDVPALAGTLFDFDDSIIGDNLVNERRGDGFRVGRIRSFTGVYQPAPNGINFFDMSPAAPGQGRTGLGGVNCSSSPQASGCALGELDLSDSDVLEVGYQTIESPDIGTWFIKPDSWTGQRRAPGRIQQTLQQMLQARIALRQTMLEYDALRLEIEDAIGTLQATFDVANQNLRIANTQRRELRNLTAATEKMKAASTVANRVAEGFNRFASNTAECIPTIFIAGLAGGGDFGKPAKCSVKIAGDVAAFALETVADGLEIAASATEASKEDVEQLAGIRTQFNDANLELFNAKGEIDALLRREPVLRAEVFARTEALRQLVGDYHATLAEGLRAYDNLISFRRTGAAEIQEYRYQDMAFRIFRNDALQKYRAAFDMAARYVYLAAAAYDYETNLLGGNGQAGQRFLTDIVRQRSLGQIIDGQPLPGTPGLADTMAQLQLNFDVLKGQMGFNNPQIETNRFSLRRELFRIPDGPEGDELWRRRLREARVDDLWSVPEFRQFARPFAPQSAGPQPGLVLEFTTNVSFGLNFFGWELGPGDSSYDSSQFATRIRSAGTWFRDYAGLPLAETPRIYLFPTGADVLRAPSANDFRTREWQVVDQVIPIPFPVSNQDLERFDWQPIADTVAGSPIDVRRFARMPAYHFSEPFDPSQVISDSRLIGRSVWNRRWVVVIPGGAFLANADEGLDTFIEGARIPGGNERDGQGVSDILIFFKTYSYSGL